jgi:hypothetical protein
LRQETEDRAEIKKARDNFRFRDEDRYLNVSKASLDAVYDYRDYDKKMDAKLEGGETGLSYSRPNPQSIIPKSNPKTSTPVQEPIRSRSKNDDVIVVEDMYDDLPPIGEDIDDIPEFVEVKTENKREQKPEPTVSDPTDSYAANLVNSEMHISKSDDVIDLGPINDNDEMFSTPRRDAEIDDFENYEQTSQDKKYNKKAQKIERKYAKRAKKAAKK